MARTVLPASLKRWPYEPLDDEPAEGGRRAPAEEVRVLRALLHQKNQEEWRHIYIATTEADVEADSTARAHLRSACASLGMACAAAARALRADGAARPDARTAPTGGAPLGRDADADGGAPSRPSEDGDSPERVGRVPARRRSYLHSQDALTAEGVPKLINEEDWEKYAARSRLLFPTGALKFGWDLWMLGLILYSSVTVPFRLCMDHPATGGWWALEVGLSLFFLADLVLTFETAYLDGDQFVLDRPMIRAHYARTWLVLDLTSSIPLELIDAAVRAFSDDGTTGSNGLRMLRALRLVRLLRLLRLLKVQKYIDMIEDALNVNLALLQLVKVIAGLAYMMHILGCGWFWLANSADADAPTWLAEYDGGAGLHAGVWSQYLHSIYWALTTLTTVGYGDIVPANDAERLYSLLCFLLGALVFGYLLSNIGDMVKNADPNAVLIAEKLDEVKVYLRWHKFKPELSSRVRRYYEFYFSRRSAMDEEVIVNQLPPMLKRSVQMHLVHRTVERIPIFSAEHGYASMDLKLEVYEMLRPVLREAKELITSELRKGAAGGREVFFLRRGTLCAEGDLAGINFYDLDASAGDAGCMVGEHAMMEGALCDCDYRGKTKVELFAVGTDDLFKLASKLAPRERDQMARAVYMDFVRRRHYRAFALRRAFYATLASSAMVGPTLVAVLRLQANWARRQAEHNLKKLTDASRLPALLPALYHKNFGEESFGEVDNSVERQLERLQHELADVKEQCAKLPSREELTSILAQIPTRAELARSIAQAVRDVAAQTKEQSP